MKIFVTLLSLFMAYTTAPAVAAPQSDRLSSAEYRLVLSSNYTSKNVRRVVARYVPRAALQALQGIDTAYELGDGYYGLASNVSYFQVRNTNGKIIAYMTVGLYSYTEDPEYVIARNFVTVSGRRLNSEVKTVTISDSEVSELPEWLQPVEE